MSGFPYGTTARYEDQTSTSPVNFCHLRKLKPAGRSFVPFLQSKVLMYFPNFYPDKFSKGSQIEEKCQISLLLNHSAKTIQSPTTERPQHPSAEPRVFLYFFFPVEPPYPYLSTVWAILLPSFSQPTTQYLLTGQEFLNIFQSESQPIWEIQEPGETYRNSSALPKEADGHKRPLLVPKLRFPVESSQEEKVHCGSP